LSARRRTDVFLEMLVFRQSLLPGVRWLAKRP